MKSQGKAFVRVPYCNGVVGGGEGWGMVGKKLCEAALGGLLGPIWTTKIVKKQSHPCHCYMFSRGHSCVKVHGSPCWYLYYLKVLIRSIKKKKKEKKMGCLIICILISFKFNIYSKNFIHTTNVWGSICFLFWTRAILCFWFRMAKVSWFMRFGSVSRNYFIYLLILNESRQVNILPLIDLIYPWPSHCFQIRWALNHLFFRAQTETCINVRI